MHTYTYENTVEFANSVDPDEVAHHEPPHLDLHCLSCSLWIFNVINQTPLSVVSVLSLTPIKKVNNLCVFLFACLSEKISPEMFKP